MADKSRRSRWFIRPRGGLVQSRLRHWFNRPAERDWFKGSIGLAASFKGSIRRRRGYGGQVAAEPLVSRLKGVNSFTR